MTDDTLTARASSIASDSHNITEEDSWLAKARAGEGSDSNQSATSGRRAHLIDFEGMDFLRERNVHHMRCLIAKTRYVSSGGFREEKISEILGPICEDGQLQPLLDSVARNLAEFHDAAIEVVWTNGSITGLHTLHPKDFWVVREADSRDYHYEIRSKFGFSNHSDIQGLRFARFGDRADMMRRLKITDEDQDRVSEVLRFSRDRHVLSEDYGTPEWLPGIPYMELETCQVQYRFDFFFNGCMPDGIYSVTGGVVNDSEWKEIKGTLQCHQGPGNRRKLMLVNIGGEDTKVQFDRLDSESADTSDGEKQSMNNALAVVTAHGVPPLIAGIVIPGKMGGNNEFPNALQAFHAQYANPVQTYICSVLAATLGKKGENGGLKVTADMFLGKTGDDKEPDPSDPTGVLMRDKNFRGNGFWTILDSINIGESDTISRMKTPLAQAQAEGRDLSAGLQQRGEDKDKGKGTNS